VSMAPCYTETIPNIRNKYSQEKTLRGYSPNSYVHVSVSNFIYSADRSAYSAAGK
jgi:hypothetical protein